MFDVLLLLAVALLSARILGYIFFKLKQPAVIGEIIAGIILGAIAFVLVDKNFSLFEVSYIFSNVEFYNWSEFNFVKEIGILFLLFISGLEINIFTLKKMKKASLFVAIGGVIVPLILGILSGFLFHFSLQQSIIIGLILIATSVGVSVRALMDIKMLNTDVGATILGGAVFDDIIGIILLAFFLGIDSPLWIGIKIAIFFFIFLYLGLRLIDRILDFGERIQLPKSLLSISLAILLIYAYFADCAGIAGIIGAFIAGVIIAKSVRSRKIIEDVKTIGYGLFIPIFFVWVGASIWRGLIYENFPLITFILFVVIFILISILGKIIGCSFGAKLAGLTTRESIEIGVGMIPRMELALIIVTAALSHGILDGSIGHQILLATVILTIITTIIAPFLIKATFKK